MLPTGAAFRRALATRIAKPQRDMVLGHVSIAFDADDRCQQSIELDKFTSTKSGHISSDLLSHTRSIGASTAAPH
jgi:hypothetical protein